VVVVVVVVGCLHAELVAQAAEGMAQLLLVRAQRQQLIQVAVVVVGMGRLLPQAAQA
jgi:hypothetical protein